MVALWYTPEMKSPSPAAHHAREVAEFESPGDSKLAHVVRRLGLEGEHELGDHEPPRNLGRRRVAPEVLMNSGDTTTWW